MLTTLTASGHRQARVEQEWPGGEGADGMAAVDLGQAAVPADPHWPCVEEEHLELLLHPLCKTRSFQLYGGTTAPWPHKVQAYILYLHATYTMI